MRRKDREITDRAAMLDILRRCEVCSVAFNAPGAPYVLPMNFGVMEREGKVFLCFHCASEGRKLELLTVDDRVGFAASCAHRLEWEDDGSCTMRYESVCGRGLMRKASEAEKRAALNVLMAHYRPEMASEPAEPSWLGMMPEVTVLLLEVEEMTGKHSVSPNAQ